LENLPPILVFMIPSDKKKAVKKALQFAFGADGFENIEPLTKGLSGALVFKIIVQGAPYVLRMIMQAETRDNPAYYFGCLQAVADAGLAPRVHYLNFEDRISISDFVQSRNFPISEARVKMADAIRSLHALPAFPYELKFLETSDIFLKKFQVSKIIPANITKDIFELYAQIGNVYPRNDRNNLVSCHNDIKPDNIIYDGIHPWLIDWEAARLNDRYVDLAATANFIVKTEKEETDFLKRYFREDFDEYKQARFFLMSQIVHMFCFTLCTISGSAGKPINTYLKTPGFNEFHERLWNAEIDLGNDEEKLQYAWVHMEKLQNNMHTQRFNESLCIVSDYHKLR